jgi:hypothetical protein
MFAMRPFLFLTALLAASIAGSLPAVSAQEKDVPWKAQAEIARRGPMVEKVGGFADANDPVTAITAAMAPPADDSHKWLITLVTMKGCQWCERTRLDFETDAKLKNWVDTKDYTKSWAHWQVVQIEDESQKWRWRDFKPTTFPCIIVQPPVNGSWGDPHTIVYAKQGYQKPAELDANLRKSIQLYAAKTFPRHLAWGKEQVSEGGISAPGFQQGGGAEQAGDWKPPVTPPSPLPALPSVAPVAPQVPAQFPPPDATPPAIQLPSLSQLLGALLTALFSLFGSQGIGNFLLFVMVAMWVLEWIAPQTPTKLDDEALAFLKEFYDLAKNRPTDPPATVT